MLKSNMFKCLKMFIMLCFNMFKKMGYFIWWNIKTNTTSITKKKKIFVLNITC